MKYINDAMERLKQKDTKDEKDLSLIERILSSEPDPKMAGILALDLIFVGIDTVSSELSFPFHFAYEMTTCYCSIMNKLFWRTIAGSHFEQPPIPSLRTAFLF